MRIADVTFRLTWDHEPPSFPAEFAPFLISADDLSSVSVTVEFTGPDAASAALVEELLPGVHDQTLVLPGEPPTTFLRPEGRLIATNGFEHCRVFPVPEHAANPLADRGWLILTLWGYLAHHGGALLHGAACEIEGHYVLFLGESGAGKSTICDLAVTRGGMCLSEEYPALTCREGAVWVHATPWYGVRGAAHETSGRLEAIYLLRHASANELRPLSPSALVSHLLKSTRFFVHEPATVPATMELLDRMAMTVPACDFGFVPAVSAVDYLCQTL